MQTSTVDSFAKKLTLFKVFILDANGSRVDASDQHYSQSAFTCSKFTIETTEHRVKSVSIKTPERHRSGVLIVNFEQIWLIVLEFLVNAGWVNSGQIKVHDSNYKHIFIIFAPNCFSKQGLMKNFYALGKLGLKKGLILLWNLKKYTPGVTKYIIYLNDDVTN